MDTPTAEATTTTDQHPAGAARFLGLAATATHEGRRKRGIICAARYVGRTARGGLPDYEVTLRGASGATVTVSLVESQLSLIDTP
jgi:hypothetical protein